MSLITVTHPTVEPVSIEEQKRHSRISGNSDDAYLFGLIVAARHHVESFLNRAIITQTLEQRYDHGFEGCFYLPRPPLIAVDHVKYLDGNGDLQTLSTDIYTVDTYSEPGRVMLAYGKSWPAVRDVENNITIRFQCGYGSVANVPKAIRLGIMWLVDHWYEHRTTVSEMQLYETPQSLKNILFPYRVIRFE